MAAILRAVQQRADVRIELFTTVPAWFFEQSGCRHLKMNSVQADVGFAQRTPLHEDLPETVNRLDRWLPFKESLVADLAQHIRQARCVAVVCDISPLGIAAAHAAGVPSVLVENFTWDWIYAAYPESSALQRHGARLAFWFERADWRIQTEPVCRRIPRADMVSAPVGRKPRQERYKTRAQLGLTDDARVALVSFAGRGDWTLPELAAACPDIFFVAPGFSGGGEAHERVIMPAMDAFYHPDLVEAADMVIAKTGYSTVAEAYWAGRPLGYMKRPRFPEHAILADFIKRRGLGLEVPAEGGRAAALADAIRRLLAMRPVAPEGENGADQIAGFLLERCFGAKR